MAGNQCSTLKRCAVVIGVNKVGNLPVLQAAEGAIEFAAWAESQNIEVVLMTDVDGNPVLLSDIKNAIKKIAGKKIYDQLIIFFAGHGILRAPDYELWLLSGAPEDVGEAVNVPGSIHLSRNLGIPHVVFISDACRSRANTILLSQVEGGSIIQNAIPRQPRPAVDIFYATLPGDPALEVPTPKAVRSYKGIFTETILTGLHGKVPEIMDGNSMNGCFVIPAWKLKEYLEVEVPRMASAYSIKLVQSPDIRVESHPPKFLALFDVLPVGTPKGKKPSWSIRTLIEKINIPFLQISGNQSNRPAQVSTKNIKINEKFFQPGELAKTFGVNDGSVATNRESHAAVKRLLESQGRLSFETNTGFTVVGANPKKIYSRLNNFDLFTEKGVSQIRLYPEKNSRKYYPSQTILIEFADGTGVPLAVLPNYLGTIQVENDRVVNVTYLPSRGSSYYRAYQNDADKVDLQRALAAVAARNGEFRFDKQLDPGSTAGFLRRYKHYDPTLGLYAAYAYFQGRDPSSVASVYRYMSKEKQPVLFDVALMAKILTNRVKIDGKGAHPIAPFCPVLTQGWAFLQSTKIKFAPLIREAGKHLQPGLWTTFDRIGMGFLSEAIKKGEIG